jgi:hypothetical protein
MMRLGHLYLAEVRLAISLDTESHSLTMLCRSAFS